MPDLFSRYGEALAQNVTMGDKPHHFRRTRCRRCGGAGRSQAWAATGYTCYQCGGNGKGPDEYVRLYTVEEIAKLDATKAKKRERKVAKQIAAATARAIEDERLAAERAEAMATDPFMADLKAFAGRSEFLADIAKKYAARDLSEAQVEAAQRIIAKVRQREAENSGSDWLGATGDRVAIEGEVRLSKCIYASTGGYMDPDKYLLKIMTPKGWAVWFTTKHYAEGDKIVGKATIKGLGEFRGTKETTITRFLKAKAA